jgi:hypothetical protein
MRHLIPISGKLLRVKSTLLHVKLDVPSPIEAAAFNGRSWFLQSVVGYRDRLALAFGGVGTTKHPNMGRISADLLSRPGGTFLIELGAILLDRLPSPNSDQEYALSVSNDRGEDSKGLFFSNQLVKVSFLSEGDPCHLICPLYRLPEIRERKTVAPPDAHIEYLKTAVTARYEIAGEDAEDALATHIENCVLDFIFRINRVLAAHLLVAPEEFGILTPSYDYGSFDYLYLFTCGADESKIRAERLGLTLFRTTLVGPRYNAEQTATLHEYLTGERQPDDVSRLMRSAKSYIEGGILHLALLQLTIAAELATTRYVHTEYLRRGVSKSKLDDRKAEITFGIMLNIEVTALAPSENKPDRQLLGRIDRIRNLRNELMHSGRFSTSQEELRELYNATKHYVRFLTQVSQAAL